jgi:hypothetical protein
MMNEMMPGMMWGMGLVWSLVVIVLILAAAALIKYLRTESREGRQWTSSSSQHCRQSPCFLLAFLKEATKPGAAPQQNAQAQMGGKSGMMGGMGGMMGGGGDSNLKNPRSGQAGQGHHVPPRQLSRDHLQRKDAALLGTQPALRDRLQQGQTGKRRTCDHAGRHAGRSRRRYVRRAGRDHQDDRSAMLDHAGIF